MSFVALLLHLCPHKSIPALPSDAGQREEESELSELQAALSQPTSLAREILQESTGSPDRIRLSALLDEHHRLCLRVTVLGENGLVSLPRLFEALCLSSTLCVGMRQYGVSAADISSSPWAGLSTWADFLSPSSGHVFRLDLGTPLVLPPKTWAPHGNCFHFPAPLVLFADLAERWQSLGGPPLPVGCDELLPMLEDGSIAIADHRLCSSHVFLDGHVHMGLLGHISYRCRKASAAYTTLVALTRFAFFAGIGAFTEVGMGTTRITIG